MNFYFSRGMVLPILVAGALALPACNSKKADKGTEQASAAAPADTAAAQPKHKTVELELAMPKGFTKQDFAKMMGQPNSPLQEVDRIAGDHIMQDPWTSKDRKIRALLQKHKGKQYYPIMQQQAAYEMLRTHLFKIYYNDPSDREVLDAFDFYTTQLVEAKSDDTQTVYKCLRALEGTWPGSKRAQVASVTAKRAFDQASKSDTTSTTGQYKMMYARELNKMANKLNG